MNMPRFLHSRIARALKNDRDDRRYRRNRRSRRGTQALRRLTCCRPAAVRGAPGAGRPGLFACRAIAKGTRLFGEDDWADEAERRSFSTLSPQQLSELKPALRAVFLRYAYNTAPDQITGTFRPESGAPSGQLHQSFLRPECRL